MNLTKLSLCGVVIFALASTMALAGDDVPGTEETGALLRLEVVMTRSQGDTVVDRFPYRLLLNSGGTGARVYGGIQLPIVVKHEGSNTVMFKNAGGNVFAKAWALEGGRFKVELSTELGGVHSAEEGAAAEAPVLRSFSTNATITLRDGQSTTLSDSADPITGETVRTDVTLEVAK